MTYGSETAALSERQESQLELTEMRFSVGETRTDRIRHEEVRGTDKVEQLQR